MDARKLKGFQLQGGFVPMTPRPGALPLYPAGGSAPNPRYRLALRALAMCPTQTQFLDPPVCDDDDDDDNNDDDDAE